MERNTLFRQGTGAKYDPFWFSDAHRERMAQLLPTDLWGKPQVDDRRVLSGIVHALRCGGRCADCADVSGLKKTLYNRFVRCAERGNWEPIFSALARTNGVPDQLFIDFSGIKVDRCGDGGKERGLGS